MGAISSGSTEALKSLPPSELSKAKEALSASNSDTNSEPPPTTHSTKDDSGIVIEGDDLLPAPVIGHHDSMSGPYSISTEVNLEVIGTKVLKDGISQTDCSSGEIDNDDQNPTLMSMMRQLKHESTRYYN